MRLEELSSQELAEEAKKRAREAQDHDAQLGRVLDRLLSTVDDLSRRLDER